MHSSTPTLQRDTRAWQFQVWASFGIAVFLCATYKAFLGVSWLYLITCAFTLAKMLRDRHEADLADARLRSRLQARTEAAE